MQNLFNESGQIWYSALVYLIIIAGMYFILFRPQQKKRKQEEELRKSISVGDEIVTIGGIVGKVLSVRADSDSIVMESGSEKIKIKKWAIGSCESK